MQCDLSGESVCKPDESSRTQPGRAGKLDDPTAIVVAAAHQHRQRRNNYRFTLRIADEGLGKCFRHAVVLEVQRYKNVLAIQPINFFGFPIFRQVLHDN
jgi:hypothetical protein